MLTNTSDHLVHHLLAIYALGASPDEIQKAYDVNVPYQKEVIVHDDATAEELQDPAVFKQRLGNHKYYHDYLKYFSKEIESKGVPAVVNEYIFKGDARADDLLARLFGGFLHPIIHLGYALEFDQPILAAEALAQACIHHTEVAQICEPAEQLAKSRKSNSDILIVDLQRKLAADPITSNAVKSTDGPDKLACMIPRAGQRVAEIASEFSVTPATLDRKTAEMIHAGVYAAAAAQRSGKVEMIDFFLMHCVNTSYFFSVFNAQPWISVANKCRLLEWKVRIDLAIFAACKTPKLEIGRVTGYQPKIAGDWDSLYRRATKYRDDGHTSKLIRALRNAERESEPYSGAPGFALTREDFLRIAHMTMDSVERMDEPTYQLPEALRHFKGMDEEVLRITVRWTRWCGLDSAWKEVPDLAEQARL